MAIHLTIHPVIPVRRDALGRLVELDLADGAPGESFMHVEVDRLSDPAALQALEASLVRILGDVRAAVGDWRAMVARIEAVIDELRPAAHHCGTEECEELIAFLGWLADNHFTFLGTVTHTLVEGADGPELQRVKGSGLKL